MNSASEKTPELAPVGVVLELPEVDQLVQPPDVAGEVADQAVRMLGQGWPALGLVQLDHLRHLAHHDVVGPEFVDRHRHLLHPGL